MARRMRGKISNFRKVNATFSFMFGTRVANSWDFYGSAKNNTSNLYVKQRRWVVGDIEHLPGYADLLVSINTCHYKYENVL